MNNSMILARNEITIKYQVPPKISRMMWVNWYNLQINDIGFAFFYSKLSPAIRFESSIFARSFSKLSILWYFDHYDKELYLLDHEAYVFLKLYDIENLEIWLKRYQL